MPSRVTDRASHPLLRLWRYARGHHREVGLATASSVLNKLFDLAPPFLIGVAVDVVVRREASLLSSLGVEDLRTQLVLLSIISAVAWILESVFQYAYQVLWRNLAQDVQHEIRMDTYAHVQDQEVSYFEERSTGGLLSVLSNDVNQLERFLNEGMNEVLAVATTVVAVGVTFLVIVPGIAWYALVPIPVIVWGSVRFQRRLAARYARVREQVGALNQTLANNLSGIATIKAFTAEKREIARVESESHEYRERNRDAIRLASAFVPLIRMVILLAFTAILLFGGFRALEGTLAVGTYSVLVFLTQRLLWPLTRLGDTLDLYRRAMASTDRLLDLLRVEPEIVDGPDLLAEPVRGAVAFEDVTFAYPTAPHTPVLESFDLRVPAGTTAGIVGATGAGKSTVVKLLLRLHDPTSGHVRIDGQDVSDVRLDSLRQAIGLVSQDVFLFHGTVRENIVYGRPGASHAQIVAAAEVAEAHDFISRLPDDYDTVVGERGQKLSGGQRQRIAIARAVLADPPILVLDEATSSVDNETEAAIQRSLDRIVEGRTTIMIAHRLSTIRDADRIHVMDAGRIVESGTHEDLLTEHGLYAALWRVQTGEVGAGHEDSGSVRAS